MEPAAAVHLQSLRSRALAILIALVVHTITCVESIEEQIEYQMIIDALIMILIVHWKYYLLFVPMYNA